MRRLSQYVLLFACLAFCLVAQQAQKQKPPEPLWHKILRVSGVSATPGAQRGPEDELNSGQIWIVTLGGLPARPLTKEAGFRWPVFAPRGRAVFALKENTLIRISLDNNNEEQLFALDGVYKLVGFNDDGQLLAVFDKGDRPSIAYIATNSGQISPIPYDSNSPEDQATLNFLKGSTRVYGKKKLYVAKETTEDVAGTIEWTDVYLRDSRSPAVDVSACDQTNCGQPSLSASEQLVVFIKAGR